MATVSAAPRTTRDVLRSSQRGAAASCVEFGFGVVWHGPAGRGPARYVPVRRGVVRYGMVRRWCGLARRGMVRLGAVRSGAASRDRGLRDKQMTQAQFVKSPRIEADVQLLLGKFRDVLCDGRVIRHEEIEAAIALSRKDHRYRTVTNGWRRVLMDEQRVFLDGRSALGQGFKALTPDDMIRYSNKRVRAIGRMLKKAIAVASLPHPSELREDQTRLYQARLLTAIHQLEGTHRRVVLDLSKALQPPRALPRASGA